MPLMILKSQYEVYVVCGVEGGIKLVAGCAGRGCNKRVGSEKVGGCALFLCCFHERAEKHCLVKTKSKNVVFICLLSHRSKNFDRT